MDHQSQPRISGGCCHHGFNGCRIIGITPYIDPQLRLRPCLKRVANSVGYDGIFLPCRDEYSGRTGQCCTGHGIAIDRLAAGATGELEPHPAQINAKIVDCTKQEEYACEKQQLVLEQNEHLP